MGCCVQSLVQTAWSMARLGYEAAVPLIRSLMLRASSTVEQVHICGHL